MKTFIKNNKKLLLSITLIFICFSSFSYYELHKRKMVIDNIKNVELIKDSNAIVKYNPLNKKATIIAKESSIDEQIYTKYKNDRKFMGKIMKGMVVDALTRCKGVEIEYIEEYVKNELDIDINCEILYEANS